MNGEMAVLAAMVLAVMWWRLRRLRGRLRKTEDALALYYRSADPNYLNGLQDRVLEMRDEIQSVRAELFEAQRRERDGRKLVAALVRAAGGRVVVTEATLSQAAADPEVLASRVNGSVVLQVSEENPQGR